MVGRKTQKIPTKFCHGNSDDVVSQRHERIGTAMIYKHLDEKEVAVGVHSPYRNLTISKYVRDETDAINQNDIWHCVKSVTTAL